MSDLVLVQQDGPVAILTLNRPPRHNSLVPALLEQMLARLDWVSRQAGIRAVVLAARGRSFSTGGDVQGFADHLSEIERYAERLVGLLNQVMLSMIRLPQPIVAAVHGVVTGGSNVYPAEVENVIYHHPAVAEVAVIGVPHPKWQEVGLAVVVVKSHQTLSAEEVIAFCQGKLARYKIPQSVVFVDSLPRTAAGKVLKRDLRSLVGENAPGGL